jgi:chromate reductase, NAD(P)H dehydrogenase (quinone)
MPQVIVIIGSLRQAAFSRKLANNLISLAPRSLSLRIAEIIQLPLYNPDLEGSSAPQAWLAFRDLVKATDAVLFVTPEHNRSVPAALKNAIDIASRPRGQNKWDGKPAAVASISPGAIGAFGSNNHLRQSLMAVNMPTMAQPEVYIGGAESVFDAAGNVANKDTRSFLASFMEAFAAWVDRNAGKEV